MSKEIAIKSGIERLTVDMDHYNPSETQDHSLALKERTSLQSYSPIDLHTHTDEITKVNLSFTRKSRRLKEGDCFFGYIPFLTDTGHSPLDETTIDSVDKI